MIGNLIRFVWNKVLDVTVGPLEDWDYESITQPEKEEDIGS
jgi:hypothetical protein